MPGQSHMLRIAGAFVILGATRRACAAAASLGFAVVALDDERFPAVVGAGRFGAPSRCGYHLSGTPEEGVAENDIRQRRRRVEQKDIALDLSPTPFGQATVRVSRAEPEIIAPLIDVDVAASLKDAAECFSAVGPS